MKKLFLLLLFTISSYSFAGCLNILKIISQKKIGVEKSLLYGKTADLYYSKKKEILDVLLQRFGTKEEIIKKKTGLYDLLLIELIKQNLADHEITQVLDIARSSINDPAFISEWADNLYRDAVLELYVESSSENISHFEERKVLPESILVKSILDRSTDAGFTGDHSNIEFIKRTIDSDEFSSILSSGKFIIDKAFKSRQHGHLIHLLHLDLLIYAVKKNNKNPLLAKKFYQWMGEKREYYIEKYVFDLNPILVWEILFDSRMNDLTSPEVLNPMLSGFFSWDQLR